MNSPDFSNMLESIQQALNRSCELSQLAMAKADAAQKTANWFAGIAIAVAVLFGLASVFFK